MVLYRNVTILVFCERNCRSSRTASADDAVDRVLRLFRIGEITARSKGGPCCWPRHSWNQVLPSLAGTFITVLAESVVANGKSAKRRGQLFWIAERVEIPYSFAMDSCKALDLCFS